MKNIISGILVLCATIAAAAPVSAGTACSDGMIRNSYGVVGTTLIQGMHCGITGVVTFRNDGTAKATMKQSCGGIVESTSGTGTYEVRPNCTATANVDFDDGDSGTFHFTVIAGGKKLMYIGAQPASGVTFTGTAEQL